MKTRAFVCQNKRRGTSVFGRMSVQHSILGALICFGLTGCTIENWFDDPDEEFVLEPWFVETVFQSPAPQVDVLWVVDNTQSMTLEHASLEASFSTFISELDRAELAYQIGVITTDMENDGGVLRGNPWIITPSLDDREGAFARAIDVGGSSTSKEAGLAAMVSALSAPVRDDENRGFRRSGAALHVIVVSDSNDHSDDWLGANAVQVANQMLQDEEDASLVPALFSAVVGDSPNGCSGATGSAMPGPRYAELASRRGGAFASICESDFDEVLEAFGSMSVVYPRKFVLENPADEATIRVSVDDEVVDTWVYEATPSSILFDEAPLADVKIQIRYQMPEEP